MKKPNIFWILTDGTRYKKGRDNYGRLPVYYEFDKESVHFEKAITSGASTLMAVTAVFTGRFSVELYPHFKYIKKLGLPYHNYFKVLKKAGYKVNSSLYHEEAGKNYFKEMLGTCVDKFPKFVVNDCNESADEFEYIMKHRFEKNKPNLVYVHLGWFNDSDSAVRRIFNYLKKESLYDDSIIITSSDHGYVDYGRFHHLGWLLQPMVHSLYVDEDTYRVTLNIKFPKTLTKIKNKIITAPVCLIDLFETIFGYIGLKYETTNKKALSLKPLIEKDNKDIIEKFKRRILRVDTRYIYQNYRKIRLINDYYTSVISSPKDIKKLPAHFKKEFLKTEDEAEKTCSKMIGSIFKKAEISKIENKKIALYNYNHKGFISFVYKELRKNNKVSVLDLNLIQKDYKKYDMVIAFVDNPYFYMYKKLVKFCKRKDINLMLLDNYFDKIKYKNYNYFKETMNDPGMIPKHFWLLKAGLYVILFYLKLHETFKLKGIKENYHPIIKGV